MALTWLPEELIEQIINHLQVKDVLSCCAVNLEWRERFNSDLFWKKFCIKEISDYLEDTSCEVSPTFQLPEQNEERLQPLCNWRIQYMKNIHLINNWKSGKYSSIKFRANDDIISSDINVDSEGIHWLFIRTKSEIEIWNIHTAPKLYFKVPILEKCINVTTLMARTKILIIQWNIISAYDLKNYTELPLKSSITFVLEEDKPLSELYLNLNDEMTNNENINEVDDYRFETFGCHLVGHERIPKSSDNSMMHIWDTQTGDNLKVDLVSDSLKDKLYTIIYINIFKIDYHKGLIHIVFQSPEKYQCSQIRIYDFKRQQFTETNIMIDGVLVWCGCRRNIIVAFSSHPGIIKFYGSNSSKLLSVREIGEWTNSGQMQLIESFLVYCMFNCINVVDIYSQEIVYCLEFSFHAFVRRLTVVEPRFLVVWLMERGGSPGCPSYHQQVWDIHDLSKKLTHCSSEQGFKMATPCPSIIKQVISCNKMVILCTFW